MPPKASLETRKKIYQSLCYVLSDRASRVAWDEYTPADWELFSQMADREGVAPLMYWKLKESPVKIPPSTFNLLRSTYYQTLAQNTLMYQELERILKALDEAGIPVIVLKGAALAATVYEDIGLRPMGDLDLLVPQELFNLAVKIMYKIGYYKKDSPELAPWLARVTRHEVALQGGPKKNIVVEIHWNLVAGNYDWRSPPLDWFWEQTKPFEFLFTKPFRDGSSPHKGVYCNSDNNNFNGFGLTLTATLLFLTAHLILQHGQREDRVLWFYDLYILIRKADKSMDWGLLISQAEEYEWTLSLQTALIRLCQMFNVSKEDNLPPSLWHMEVDTSKANRLVQMKSSQIRSSAMYDWEQLTTLNSLGRLGYTIAIVLPSPSYIYWRYKPRPGWLWPLYYPYRWLRMLREVLSTISSLIFAIRD